MMIDACGLSCPQPVVLTMNAMKDKTSPLEIWVDTRTACENIQRLAEKKDYDIQIVRLGEKFQLTLTR